MSTYATKQKDTFHLSFFRRQFSSFMPKFATTKGANIELTKSAGGQVYIVGAGPGDAELLTIKAYKAIQCADIVMFDCLVDESTLSLIPPHTETEFVGKRAGKHSMQQDEICQRILFHARNGKTVVRLKGGDPAIFARTVEESDILTKNNIPFCIIPGITSASGASAYTGIPLTHRECAQSVRFITASLRNIESEPNWDEIVDGSDKQTIVFYMGLRKLSLISQRLASHKMPVDMPVAVVDKACSENQQIVQGTISDIAYKVEQAQFSGPAMIIVGKVVNYRQMVSSNMLTNMQFAAK